MCISKRIMWIISKNYRKFFFCIFLQYTHQVDTNKVVKCSKHFFGYFNTLETHRTLRSLSWGILLGCGGTFWISNTVAFFGFKTALRPINGPTEFPVPFLLKFISFPSVVSPSRSISPTGLAFFKSGDRTSWLLWWDGCFCFANGGLGLLDDDNGR